MKWFQNQGDAENERAEGRKCFCAVLRGERLDQKRALERHFQLGVFMVLVTALVNLDETLPLSQAWFFALYFVGAGLFAAASVLAMRRQRWRRLVLAAQGLALGGLLLAVSWNIWIEPLVSDLSGTPYEPRAFGYLPSLPFVTAFYAVRLVSDFGFKVADIKKATRWAKVTGALVEAGFVYRLVTALVR